MEKRRRDGNKFYKNFPVFVASSVPCFHDDREIRKNNKGFKDTKDWLSDRVWFEQTMPIKIRQELYITV